MWKQTKQTGLRVEGKPYHLGEWNGISPIRSLYDVMRCAVTDSLTWFFQSQCSRPSSTESTFSSLWQHKSHKKKPLRQDSTNLPFLKGTEKQKHLTWWSLDGQFCSAQTSGENPGEKHTTHRGYSGNRLYVATTKTNIFCPGSVLTFFFRRMYLEQITVKKSVVSFIMSSFQRT